MNKIKRFANRISDMVSGKSLTKCGLSKDNPIVMKRELYPENKNEILSLMGQSKEIYIQFDRSSKPQYEKIIHSLFHNCVNQDINHLDDQSGTCLSKLSTRSNENYFQYILNGITTKDNSKITKSFTKWISSPNNKHEIPRKPFNLPDMNQSKEERIEWWIKNGNHGDSSNYMLNTFRLSSKTKKDKHHFIKFPLPHDVYDFRRCLELIKCVPEFRKNFNKLSVSSFGWELLIDNWNSIENLFEKGDFDSIQGRLNCIHSWASFADRSHFINLRWE